MTTRSRRIAITLDMHEAIVIRWVRYQNDLCDRCRTMLADSSGSEVGGALQALAFAGDDDAQKREIHLFITGDPSAAAICGAVPVKRKSRE